MFARRGYRMQRKNKDRSPTTGERSRNANPRLVNRMLLRTLRRHFRLWVCICTSHTCSTYKSRICSRGSCSNRTGTRKTRRTFRLRKFRHRVAPPQATAPSGRVKAPQPRTTGDVEVYSSLHSPCEYTLRTKSNPTGRPRVGGRPSSSGCQRMGGGVWGGSFRLGGSSGSKIRKALQIAGTPHTIVTGGAI